MTASVGREARRNTSFVATRIARRNAENLYPKTERKSTGRYAGECKPLWKILQTIANAIRHCKQSIAAQKYRPLRHVNEPTQTRWVPSSSVPASLTTKDTCTKRDCVGSLNKLDGSPSCFAGDGIPLLYGLEFGLPVLTLHKSCLTIEYSVRMHWRAPL